MNQHPCIGAHELVDQLDHVTPAEVLDHLCIPAEGFTARPLALVDAAGAVVARCETYLAADVIAHLAATHTTTPDTLEHRRAHVAVMIERLERLVPDLDDDG